MDFYFTIMGFPIAEEIILDCRTESRADNLKLSDYSTVSKVLSCVPFLGILPFLINEHSLRQKISFVIVLNPHDLVEVIKTKNHYKTAFLIQSCLTVGIFVLGFGIVGPTVWLFGTLTVLQSYSLLRNRETMRTLATTNDGLVNVF